jgi:hypothetical protein
MHYYIDGYNWLFRTPKTNLSFEEKRRKFIADIQDLVSESSCVVTIVFDSSDPTRTMSTRGHYQSLEIVYTPKMQTADQYIEEVVESAQHPGHLTVITMDRELKNKCLLRGASVLNMKEFFDIFAKKKNNVRTSHEDSFKKILKESPSQIARLLAVFEKKLLDDILDK